MVEPSNDWRDSVYRVKTLQKKIWQAISTITEQYFKGCADLHGLCNFIWLLANIFGIDNALLHFCIAYKERRRD